MLCLEYLNFRISILDCVTSPGYNLHFTERVSRALTHTFGDITSSILPCGPLGEMRSGVLGKRQQKSAFSFRNVTLRCGSQLRKGRGLLSPWRGSCTWEPAGE